MKNNQPGIPNFPICCVTDVLVLTCVSHQLQSRGCGLHVGGGRTSYSVSHPKQNLGTIYHGQTRGAKALTARYSPAEWLILRVRLTLAPTLTCPTRGSTFHSRKKTTNKNITTRYSTMCWCFKKVSPPKLTFWWFGEVIPAKHTQI